VREPEVPQSSKLAFSNRFRHRLQGRVVVPVGDREAIIWRLVEFIENQYPRSQWPHVYTSLLNIHRAQENSICKLRADSAPPHVDVLRFSFEKGGASVLADAWLAAGSLSQEEARIAFDWGVLLQLIDDLQDMQQDLRRGNLTIYTQSCFGSEPSACTYLDEITTQTPEFRRSRREATRPHGPWPLHNGWRQKYHTPEADDANEFFASADLVCRPLCPLL
jgi:hypothetical protein